MSLTFGGRRAEGRGFSTCLTLRYVLETCTSVKEATETIARIPPSMSQNVTVLDRTGAFAAVFIGADRAPAILTQPVCTNHQETVVWPERGERSRTVERAAALRARLDDPATTLDALVDGMLRPPLYVFDERQGFATVYSAVYRPAEGAVEYFWPGHRWRQGFDRFTTGRYTHEYRAVEVG